MDKLRMKDDDIYEGMMKRLGKIAARRMKNPWYWKCEKCGAVQPAHPDTEQMVETCRKWVCKGPGGGFCGGTFVKHKEEEPC